ncbi:MAG TPA: hypothetical protein PKB02_14540 [Anaerohalosphaeraceae bacterium]|nr:hypothetical protein [Anaerohalosphaeraceae bacterium]
MSLHFLHIGYLAWIIPAIGGLWFAWRKRGTSPAGRHYVLALISLGYVLGIIAALAEPYIGTVQNKTCVFVTDISASVPDSELTRISQRIRELAASAQTGLDMHLVCFASHPVRIPEFPFPGMSWDLAELRRSKKDIFESLPDNYYRQTDIQAALLYAQMLIKNNGVVHLFTDGLETRGAVEQAVQAGLRQNIQYHYEVLNSPQTDELVLSKVVVPQQVRQGQNRSMQVLLESSRDADVEVVVNNLNTNATQRLRFSPGLTN